MEKDGYGYEDDQMTKGGLPSEKTTLTPEKAKKMLKEDEPRSKAQRGFLGSVAGKGEKKKD